MNVYIGAIFHPPSKRHLLQTLIKTGDKTCAENYRPISLISSIAEVLKKIVKEYLESYWKRYKIISEKKVWTSKGKINTRSNTSNLLNQKNVYCYGQKTICIFVDLAGGFNMFN